LSKASPPQHGVEDDNHTKHSGSLLQSRVQKQIKNHHTPHRTKVETPLVANPLVFHKPEICERSKTSEKKLAGMSERIGQVFGGQKQIPRRCANRIRQFFNVRFAVCSDPMDIARIAKT
jgi:hypothetical protein